MTLKLRQLYKKIIMIVDYSVKNYNESNIIMMMIIAIMLIPKSIWSSAVIIYFLKAFHKGFFVSKLLQTQKIFKIVDIFAKK